VVIGTLALSMPVLMQILTDDVLVRGDLHMLASLSIGIMLLTSLRHALGWVQGHLVGHFGQKLQLQMILHYGQRLFHLPINYFESHRSGEVVSRINDIQRINELLTTVVTGLPSQLCIAAISLVWMLTYSAPLTLAALGCYTAVVLCNLCFLPLIQQKTKQLLVGSADNQGYLVEVFRAATVLKTTEAHTPGLAGIPAQLRAPGSPQLGHHPAASQREHQHRFAGWAHLNRPALVWEQLCDQRAAEHRSAARLQRHGRQCAGLSGWSERHLPGNDHWRVWCCAVSRKCWSGIRRKCNHRLGIRRASVGRRRSVART